MARRRACWTVSTAVAAAQRRDRWLRRALNDLGHLVADPPKPPRLRPPRAAAGKAKPPTARPFAPGSRQRSGQFAERRSDRSCRPVSPSLGACGGPRSLAAPTPRRPRRRRRRSTGRSCRRRAMAPWWKRPRKWSLAACATVHHAADRTTDAGDADDGIALNGPGGIPDRTARRRPGSAGDVTGLRSAPSPHALVPGTPALTQRHSGRSRRRRRAVTGARLSTSTLPHPPLDAA